MGWTSMNRAKGMSDVEFFTKEWALEKNGMKIVACNSAGGFGGVFYAAIDNGKGEVFAITVLKSWTPRDYYNFTWKEIEESSGPYTIDASQKVLDALTPTKSEYAIEWRAKVAARLAAKKAAPTLRKGMIIRVANPVPFANGQSYEYFMIGDRGRIEKALSTADSQFGPRVRFAKFRQSEFEIVR
jgi:hypothetical protein